jgi:fructose-bisphosphate aldolase class II
MHSLRELLKKSQENRVAIGHFNVSDLVLLKAVFEAARELNVPVLVGLSEGEREFVGTGQIAALVRSLREEFDFPIFLNADHTHSLAKGIEAAKAGFDSIVFDLSALPLEENARRTKQAVEALKAINPSMLVEGEIGDIGTGSEIHESSPDLSRTLNLGRSKTVRREHGRGYPGTRGRQYARHAQEHGRRRNEEAFGYRENSGNQAGGRGLPNAPWRLRNRR